MAKGAWRRIKMEGNGLMNINRVSITGNLVRAPELRMTASGTQVLSMRVAVNERVHNRQTDEWENYPNFFNAVMFGNRAEALHSRLAKGAKIAIDGKLRYRAWDQDGERRSTVEIIVNELEFMGNTGAEAKQPQSAAPEAAELYDEDVDF